MINPRTVLIGIGRHIFHILLAASVAVLLSCQSVPEEVGETSGAGNPQGQAQSENAGTPGSGSAVEGSGTVIDLTGRDGSPRFLGVANRLQDRDEEDEAAILHVAEQAVRYQLLEAQYQLVAQKIGRSLGYLDEVETNWDEGAAGPMVDRVEVLSATQRSDATFVIATVEGLETAPRLPNVGTGNPPAWLDKPPQVEGYLVGIGTAQRRRTLRESFEQADVNALSEILLQSNTTLRIVSDQRSVEGSGNTSARTVAQEAAAALEQFHVVARFVSADGNYYYSLAIARER